MPFWGNELKWYFSFLFTLLCYFLNIFIYSLHNVYSFWLFIVYYPLGRMISPSLESLRSSYYSSLSCLFWSVISAFKTKRPPQMSSLKFYFTSRPHSYQIVWNWVSSLRGRYNSITNDCLVSIRSASGITNFKFFNSELN